MKKKTPSKKETPPTQLPAVLTWENGRRKLGELVPWDRNPRQISKEQADRLLESLDQFGQIQTIAIGPANEIYDGHQRDAVWAASSKYGPEYEVDVRIASRPLATKERAKLVVMLHKGTVGDFDFDQLANLEGVDVEDLTAWGFKPFELGIEPVDSEAGSMEIHSQFVVMIECADEAAQTKVLNECLKKKWLCKSVGRFKSRSGNEIKRNFRLYKSTNGQ